MRKLFVLAFVLAFSSLSNAASVVRFVSPDEFVSFPAKHQVVFKLRCEQHFVQFLQREKLEAQTGTKVVFVGGLVEEDAFPAPCSGTYEHAIDIYGLQGNFTFQPMAQ